MPKKKEIQRIDIRVPVVLLREIEKYQEHKGIASHNSHVGTCSKRIGSVGLARVMNPLSSDAPIHLTAYRSGSLLGA
jgi:hypothetical protein